MPLFVGTTPAKKKNTCCTNQPPVTPKFKSSHLFIPQILQHFFITAGSGLNLRRVFPSPPVCCGTFFTSGALVTTSRGPRFLAGLTLSGPRGSGAPLPNAEGIKVNGFTLKCVLDAAEQAAVFLSGDLVSRAGTGEINRQVVLCFLPISSALCHGGVPAQVTEKYRETSGEVVSVCVCMRKTSRLELNQGQRWHCGST